MTSFLSAVFPTFVSKLETLSHPLLQEFWLITFCQRLVRKHFQESAPSFTQFAGQRMQTSNKPLCYELKKRSNNNEAAGLKF
jgi:hypothetical protein